MNDAGESNLLQVPGEGIKRNLTSSDIPSLKPSLSRNSASTGTATPLSISSSAAAAPDDYINPLEASSRWYLNAKAQAIRHAARLGFSLGNWSDAPTPSASNEVWLDATISKTKGKQRIKVEVWYPPRPPTGERAALINFHGGGWILGQGKDDARWVGSVVGDLDAVVFTVNYRLAPTHPFPTPMEDCVDSIIQIAARAPEFGIDPTKIILSGFSAGATNAITSWIALQDPSRWGYRLPEGRPTIKGLVLFYPTLDITVSRPGKRQFCTRPERTLSPGLTDLIDASYFYPAVAWEQRCDPLMSPGLMPDELLKHLPPIHMVLCEYDMLLAEGIRFAERLRGQEKALRVRIVDKEGHAWDKPPLMAPKPSVYVEYGKATSSMASWLGLDTETDVESVSSKRSRRSLIRRPKHLMMRAISNRH